MAYNTITKPTTTYTGIAKPLSAFSPVIDECSHIINSLSEIIDVYTMDIFQPLSKPSTTYTNINKPTL